MKRTPFKRTTWLRRTRPMKRKRARRTATTDYDYMAAVRMLPCCAPMDTGRPWNDRWSTECGPYHFDDDNIWALAMEANHAGSKVLEGGTSKKTPEDTCIPLCNWHHQQYTTNEGQFHRWTKEQRREWSDSAISSTRSAIAEMRRAA